MASTFGATSSVGLMATPRNVHPQRKCNFRVKAAKELYFNKDGVVSVCQTGVNKLADLVIP